MPKMTTMNRKQRRNQRRAMKLRGDGTERSTLVAPPPTRRTKRMLVPSMTSPMVAHAEQLQQGTGMLDKLANRLDAPRPYSEAGMTRYDAAAKPLGQVGGSPDAPVEAAGCTGCGNQVIACSVCSPGTSVKDTMHEEAAGSACGG